ncbi:hypothetical protein ACLIA0_03435 [Bacillaceae bacterium W0354]
MTQSFYGLLLFIFLILPPVANFLESIMILHMHMQMPLIIISGFLMADFFKKKFPAFFEKWNPNGLPGILLFVLIVSYWMIPRTMDDALQFTSVELFKFVSLAFFAGVPLRLSWNKLSEIVKNSVFIIFFLLFTLMGGLYVFTDNQLCNNYLLIEQLTLGWGFILMAVCIIIYLIQDWLIDPSDYE